MKVYILRITKVTNLPRVVCHATLGKQHTTTHRMVAGVVIMAVGVGIAKSAGYFHWEVMHYLLDALGYGIHGLGLTPFLETMLEDEV